MNDDRLVYYFGRSGCEGSRADTQLLGGKGANLAEMTRIGVPVPPGFTITTAVCLPYLRGEGHPGGLDLAVGSALERLERETGKTFGGSENPLLVSVRSGSAASMPGMMDTILNLGLNDETVAALARSTGNERFALDSYRRFVQMYGEVVLGIAPKSFADALEAKKRERGVEHDTELDAGDLRALVAEFKALVERGCGRPFPERPRDQLWGAIDAVFDSWNNERAIHYRRVNRIPDDLGTAVSVVTMVYGNMGDDSGTGVAFTRDPSTGENMLFGEFLPNAQGEDVVAGIRDPLSIEKMADHLPAAYEQVREVAATLERHYRDAQDIEFTVERGTLYLLQTRTAKRTAAAAVRIAVDMVDEGLIEEREAVLRVPATALNQLLHPQIDPAAEITVLATGLPASPGADSGRVVFNPETAIEWSGNGEPVILVRTETSPDDFEGMVASRAILTTRGGMTSHAAVVARGMGMCCVVGARDVHVDEPAGCFRVGESSVAQGDWITLDGSSGRVLAGRVPTVEPALSGYFERLMDWADGFRRLRVRTNADTPTDAQRAREYGAQGIGLCRTEHMFFEGGRIDTVREMILAGDEARRRDALGRLLPMQRSDFEGIFRAMHGLPVTIRLLDPPLHEFLPHDDHEVKTLADRLGIEPAELRARVERLREANPMLGHRGVRLAISHPEIAEMQVRAIFEAAAAAAADGVKVHPEVMIPLVGAAEELSRQAALVSRVADAALAEAGLAIPYTVGTMIEVPRAALTAADIAAHADFFSFGTNDLTQTTFGISRDDASTFLPRYLEERILPEDPFQTLDVPGVGRLVEMAVRDGRAASPALKVGICGEHGGDPDSIAFFHRLGLDYVSCSPYRVPIARLAAAQAALRAEADEALRYAAPDATDARLDARSAAFRAGRRRRAEELALAAIERGDGTRDPIGEPSAGRA